MSTGLKAENRQSESSLLRWWSRHFNKQSSWTKVKMHYIYYLLAAFDLGVITLSLALNHQIADSYQKAVTVNQEWSDRLHMYSELGELASKVNAPGNDVFENGEVANESERLQQNYQDFQNQIELIYQDIETNVEPEQASHFLSHVRNTDAAIANMVTEANRIFADFENNRPELAGQRMAVMDRRLAEASTALSELRHEVSRVQNGFLSQQQAQLDRMRRLEWLVASIMLVLVCGVTLYGHQIARQSLDAQAKEALIKELTTSQATLQTQAQELEQLVSELKDTQIQLVQSEKMSGLGQMVAGIAHEINNPINFIQGNIKPLEAYFGDLRDVIETYQSSYPQPTQAISDKQDEIDLDFTLQDTEKLLKSMKMGTQRVRDIVVSLRNYSRLDEAVIKEVDIHEGIESTLLILNHRIKQGVNVIKEFGDLPKVRCSPAQLNQVYTNIISNAIDAMEDSRCQQKQLKISTHLLSNGRIQIRLSDSGVGIPEAVKNKMFDPFFTTKGVGKGTGLGLGICFKIIQHHQGTIEVNSEVNKGSEFIITLPVDIGEPQ